MSANFRIVLVLSICVSLYYFAVNAARVKGFREWKRCQIGDKRYFHGEEVKSATECVRSTCSIDIDTGNATVERRSCPQRGNSNEKCKWEQGQGDLPFPECCTHYICKDVDDPDCTYALCNPR